MMQDWFLDAKFGIFIHWGIYSAGDTSESWAFFNGEIEHNAYMAQAKTFTAARYNPEAWAELFSAAGAKYAVLTAKHHDGFALWDTAQNKLNARAGCPAGRDLVGPYCQALRNKGLHVGLYFSQLDWTHPDYASVLPKRLHTGPITDPRRTNRFAYPQGVEDPVAWERYVKFHRAQLRELCERYHPELLWFDGDWERDPEQFKFKELREELHAWSPGVVLNSRMGGYGDYGTPEQVIPITAPGRPWEYCVTINDSWGYQKKDHHFKTVRQCVRMLAECVGMGGNLLLDVGPKSDGTIVPEQEAVLRGMGRWTGKHAAAIYGTRSGLPAGYFYGPSALNQAGDRLYLFCLDRPYDAVAVKGLKNKIRGARVVGDKSELRYRTIGGAPWAGIPGEMWIDVPENLIDSETTVLEVELEGPLNLYRGVGDHL